MKNLSTRHAAGKFMARQIAHQNSLGTRGGFEYTRSSLNRTASKRNSVNSDGTKSFVVGQSLVDGEDVVV